MDRDENDWNECEAFYNKWAREHEEFLSFETSTWKIAVKFALAWVNYLDRETIRRLEEDPLP